MATQHDIPVEDAAKLTRNYREAYGIEESKGFFFERAKIEGILGGSGCTGIRIYYGENAIGEDTLILVGVTGSEGNDPPNLNDIVTKEKPFRFDPKEISDIFIKINMN